MKKMLRAASLMTALTMLLCTAVWATEPVERGIYGVDTNVMHDFLTPEGTPVEPTDVEGFGAYYPSAMRFTVTYSGAQVGAEYFLAVAAGTAAPGGEKTVYADQIKATATSLSFHVFPTALAEGSYTVYLTGGGRKLSDGALATFSCHVPRFEVRGTAVSWSKSNDASYFLYDGAMDDETILTDMARETPLLALDYTAEKAAVVTEDTAGLREQSFAFGEVDAGTYKLAVSKSDCRTRILAVDLSRGSSADLRVNLLIREEGDVNGTGHRDATDTQNIYTYLSTGVILGGFCDDVDYYLAAADVNGSGEVNILDYQWHYELLKSEEG